MIINTDEVHVGFLDLMEMGTTFDALTKMLSQDEYERSCRFAFPHLKARFTRARAQLRIILSQYLNEAPDHIQFCYGKYGKPMLMGNQEIQFNLSHSENCVVYAISHDSEVGIDIEYIQEKRYSKEMEALCLCESEQKTLETLSFSERIDHFYSLWTYKEALLKGLGCGLQYPLTELDIDLSNTLPTIRTEDPNLKEWMLYPLSCPNNFKGAIAIKAKNKRIQYKNFCI